MRKEKLLVTNNFSFLDGTDFENFLGTEPKFDPKGIILILFIKGH